MSVDSLFAEDGSKVTMRLKVTVRDSLLVACSIVEGLARTSWVQPREGEGQLDQSLE